MLCFRSLRRCAPGPQTMLEASHMPEASIHGSLLARPGRSPGPHTMLRWKSLRENERFPPHVWGPGDLVFISMHRQRRTIRSLPENITTVFQKWYLGRNAYFLPGSCFHFLHLVDFFHADFRKMRVFRRGCAFFAGDARFRRCQHCPGSGGA